MYFEFALLLRKKRSADCTDFLFSMAMVNGRWIFFGGCFGGLMKYV